MLEVTDGAVSALKKALAETENLKSALRVVVKGFG